MTSVLDLLHRGCRNLSALLIAGIAGIILGQVIGRFFGLYIPAADEISALMMSVSVFLGLSNALRDRLHIRVTLLLHHLPAGMRTPMEIWCHVAGSALIGFGAWHAVAMAWTSWELEAISYSQVPLPLWIPHAAMAVGLVLLFVAFLQETIRVIANRHRPWADDAPGLLHE